MGDCQDAAFPLHAGGPAHRGLAQAGNQRVPGLEAALFKNSPGAEKEQRACEDKPGPLKGCAEKNGQQDIDDGFKDIHAAIPPCD